MKKETVSESVTNIIKRIYLAMGGSQQSINEKTKLFEDLGFVTAFRRELAKPLSIISKKNGGKRISKAEAGKLKSVKDAVKLVTDKIKAGVQ